MAYISRKFETGDLLDKEAMNNIIEGIDEKQPLLMSGVNIKTVNGSSILGEGDLSFKDDELEMLHPVSTIESTYFKKNGDLTTLSGWTMEIFDVSNVDKIFITGQNGNNTAVALYAFGDDIEASNFSSVGTNNEPIIYGQEIENKDNNQYLFINTGSGHMIQVLTGNVNEYDKRITAIEGFIGSSNVHATPSGELNGYISKNGSWSQTTTATFKAKYYKVHIGDKLHIYNPGLVSNYSAYAFFRDVPNYDTKADMYVPWTEGSEWDVVSPYEGYLAISNSSSNMSSAYVAKKGVPADGGSLEIDGIDDVKNAVTQIEKGYIELPFTNIIDGYYLRSNLTWTSLSGTKVAYVTATAGEYFCVSKSPNSYFLPYVIFETEPTNGLEIVNYGTHVDGFSFFKMPYDGYVAISGNNLRDMHIYKQVATATPVMYPNQVNPTVLYLGDSISTGNNFKWKGYLETYYGYKHARNLSGKVAPADGGITVIPPVTEDESNSKKSIWYRCANQTMADYTFDCINLFGGTNDLVDKNLVLGTVNDTPYLDTAESRPETLTYAASLMGCIEMLQRDFPTKPLILCTVMPMPGYGAGETGNGNTFAEAMAILQCQIGVKYNIPVVAWYWDMETNPKGAAFFKDGVHPNEVGAFRMSNIWYNTVDKYLSYNLENIRLNKA